MESSSPATLPVQSYSGTLSYGAEGWEECPRVSLHEAAKSSALWNAFVDNVCKCKSGCSTHRYRCFKQNISCSSHCHGGHLWCNKSYEKE